MSDRPMAADVRGIWRGDALDLCCSMFEADVRLTMYLQTCIFSEQDAHVTAHTKHQQL